MIDCYDLCRAPEIRSADSDRSKLIIKKSEWCTGDPIYSLLNDSEEKNFLKIITASGD